MAQDLTSIREAKPATCVNLSIDASSNLPQSIDQLLATLSNAVGRSIFTIRVSWRMGCFIHVAGGDGSMFNLHASLASRSRDAPALLMRSYNGGPFTRPRQLSVARQTRPDSPHRTTTID